MKKSQKSVKNRKSCRPLLSIVVQNSRLEYKSTYNNANFLQKNGNCIQYFIMLCLKIRGGGGRKRAPKRGESEHLSCLHSLLMDNKMKTMVHLVGF